jgi:hypothetical protein
MAKYGKTFKMWELEEAVYEFFNTFDADPIKCPMFMDTLSRSSMTFQAFFWKTVYETMSEEVEQRASWSA